MGAPASKRWITRFSAGWTFEPPSRAEAEPATEGNSSPSASEAAVFGKAFQEDQSFPPTRIPPAPHANRQQSCSLGWAAAPHQSRIPIPSISQASAGPDQGGGPLLADRNTRVKRLKQVRGELQGGNASLLRPSADTDLPAQTQRQVQSSVGLHSDQENSAFLANSQEDAASGAKLLPKPRGQKEQACTEGNSLIDQKGNQAEAVLCLQFSELSAEPNSQDRTPVSEETGGAPKKGAPASSFPSVRELVRRFRDAPPLPREVRAAIPDLLGRAPRCALMDSAGNMEHMNMPPVLLKSPRVPPRDNSASSASDSSSASPRPWPTYRPEEIILRSSSSLESLPAAFALSPTWNPHAQDEANRVTRTGDMKEGETLPHVTPRFDAPKGEVPARGATGAEDGHGAIDTGVGGGEGVLGEAVEGDRTDGGREPYWGEEGHAEGLEPSRVRHLAEGEDRDDESADDALGDYLDEFCDARASRGPSSAALDTGSSGASEPVLQGLDYFTASDGDEGVKPNPNPRRVPPRVSHGGRDPQDGGQCSAGGVENATEGVVPVTEDAANGNTSASHVLPVLGLGEGGGTSGPPPEGPRATQTTLLYSDVVTEAAGKQGVPEGSRSGPRIGFPWRSPQKSALTPRTSSEIQASPLRARLGFGGPASPGLPSFTLRGRVGVRSAPATPASQSVLLPHGSPMGPPRALMASAPLAGILSRGSADLRSPPKPIDVPGPAASSHVQGSAPEPRQPTYLFRSSADATLPPTQPPLPADPLDAWRRRWHAGKAAIFPLLPRSLSAGRTRGGSPPPARRPTPGIKSGKPAGKAWRVIPSCAVGGPVSGSPPTTGPFTTFFPAGVGAGRKEGISSRRGVEGGVGRTAAPASGLIGAGPNGGVRRVIGADGGVRARSPERGRPPGVGVRAADGFRTQANGSVKRSAPSIDEIVPSPPRVIIQAPQPKPALRRRSPSLTHRGFQATLNAAPNPTDYPTARPGFTAAGAALRNAVREARGENSRPELAVPAFSPPRATTFTESTSGGGGRVSPPRNTLRGDVGSGVGDALLRSRVLPDLDAGEDAAGDILERWRAARKAARPRPRGMQEMAPPPSTRSSGPAIQDWSPAQLYAGTSNPAYAAARTSRPQTLLYTDEAPAYASRAQTPPLHGADAAEAPAAFFTANPTYAHSGNAYGGSAGAHANAGERGPDTPGGFYAPANPTYAYRSGGADAGPAGRQGAVDAGESSLWHDLDDAEPQWASVTGARRSGTPIRDSVVAGKACTTVGLATGEPTTASPQQGPHTFRAEAQPETPDILDAWRMRRAQRAAPRGRVR